MQTIFPTSLTPEQYAAQDQHLQVPPPELCPNCQCVHILEALAYYRRYISTALAEVLQIWVRRFICRHCRITVSCLPAFAQPYRVVNTPTVTAGFKRQATPQVARWSDLIAAYWKRFTGHLPALVRRVGPAFGPVSLQPTPESFWRQLLDHCGDLAVATEQLIHQFQTCLFAHYRCHQRRPPRGK